MIALFNQKFIASLLLWLRRDMYAELNYMTLENCFAVLGLSRLARVSCERTKDVRFPHSIKMSFWHFLFHLPFYLPLWWNLSKEKLNWNNATIQMFGNIKVKKINPIQNQNEVETKSGLSRHFHLHKTRLKPKGHMMN